MNIQAELLINQGNQYRTDRQYEQALACYAQAFILDRHNVGAFNNYGNVLREVGEPKNAIPFLSQAMALDPNHTTARFNLSVCLLLLGDYQQGWPAYESRWQFEHLAGTLPNFSQPRWVGQDLTNKTILVLGEQGHGDNIQFCRFLWNLKTRGARVLFQTTGALVPLFASGNTIIDWVGNAADPVPEFDYWVPLMSIPAIIGLTLENLPRLQGYLAAPMIDQQKWSKILGPKTRMRVGFCWSGRTDSWINQHKSVPFDLMFNLIQKNPQYEWINLQADASQEHINQLSAIGVRVFNSEIKSFLDTAALMSHLDVVLGVDTAVSHLGGALGRSTWIMLNKYAVDWRYLLDRSDCPWYPSAHLFRQPSFDDWPSVLEKVHKFLELNKI